MYIRTSIYTYSMYVRTCMYYVHACITYVRTYILYEVLHSLLLLQNAGITMYYIAKETKYSQIVLHIAHAAMETSNVNHNSVISMVLAVMQLVTLITIPLTVVTLIFKDLVSTSSLNLVTLKNSL